jgi:acetyl-CoA synthetase
MTSKYVFDLKESDTFWCTADVGWVTGHSYVVYGILANGATTLMYEGAPNHPEPDRFWSIIDRHRVTVFYTAPTAIRAFMRWGDEFPKKHNLKSLRLLGSVGEPINPEAWLWYYNVIGGKRCPIVDTWWQTETGMIMITPLAGAIPQKPGSATLPFFGVVPKVVDDLAVEVPRNTGGKLVLTRPWPAMLRTLWGDDERFKRQYWSEFAGRSDIYFTGDGCRQDKDGYFWIVGRIDDVLNVSGHRIGTAEVESALVSHSNVAEAAAVGRPDDMKGQALVVFVTLKNGIAPSDALKETLRAHVAKEIGALARPDNIRFAAALPKTRSGKIMRRLLKEIAAGGEVKGDITTLEDFSVVAKLQTEE